MTVTARRKRRAVTRQAGSLPMSIIHPVHAGKQEQSIRLWGAGPTGTGPQSSWQGSGHNLLLQLATFLWPGAPSETRGPNQSRLAQASLVFLRRSKIFIALYCSVVLSDHLVRKRAKVHLITTFPRKNIFSENDAQLHQVFCVIVTP